MELEDDWRTPRSGRTIADAGMGALRVTLLFGSAAVALALLLAPIAETQTQKMLYSSYAPGVDRMVTGTIGGGGQAAFGQRAPSSYTVRRSVLQPTPNSVCIIRQNGSKTGDC